jgi:hypothetical protein
MAGFGMVAAIKVGLFCASSEEEGFVRATEMKEGGVGVAATMVGFGGAATRWMMASKAEEVAEAMAGFGGAATSQMMATMAEEVAVAKAGLGFFASSEEEGFGRATKEEMEVGAPTMAGSEEAAVSSMRSSTGLEVVAVMAG